MQYLRVKDIQGMLGVSKSTIYRWMDERNFPTPIKFSAKAVRWRLDDIEKWITQQPNG
ncbi:AlpA family transcriptional regulator [Idiomarina piscisalsi]|uniref:AlpA family transcriptional regulator n=1 Tax=Idiomarina piscisalsi TaxID=1096243 RepID=A0ABN5AVT6_9GAMM|nr:AlpA family phage regulatory protein [Idiomarina piscisalsi]ASG66812.1 AlpA family transcriptional regulator [Idiomarina piscisalsi]